MDDTSASARRVDRLGEYLLRTVGDLPEVAQEWNQLDPGVRATWSLDWHQTIAMDLPFLEAQYKAGVMTKAQQTRYRKLLKQLGGHLPLIERLGLTQPRVPLAV